MATTIITKNGSGAPLAGDLTAGELAVDLTNKRLYSKDSGGNVIELGTNAGSSTLSDLTVTGDLTVDTDTLVVDSTNDRVGINRTPTTFNVEFDGSAQLIYDRSGSNTAQVVIGSGGTSNVIIDGDTVQLRDEAGVLQVTKDSNGNVGIGGVPKEKLHVITANNGLGTVADASADELVLENTGDTGMTFLSPNTATQTIAFGDTNNRKAGWIEYDHSTNDMAFGTVNATSERMRITGTGNVGIGTNTPRVPLDTNGMIRTISKAGAYPADGKGLEMYYESGSDAAVLLSYDRDAPAYKPLRFEGSEIPFFISGTERMRINSSGNLVISTSGNGIDFSATGDGPSMSSELLDDYEEGSWTPVVDTNTSSSTVTHSIQSGTYTKIGNRVFYQMYVTFNLTSGGTGFFYVTLPFNVAAGNYYAAGSIAYQTLYTVSAGHHLGCYTEQGMNRIYFTQNNSIQGAPAATAHTLMIAGHYHV